LGDTIAHIVKLGDMGWSTISARRARSHLVEIYKLVERFRSPNAGARESLGNALREFADFSPETAGRRQRLWLRAMDNIQTLVQSVDELLSDLDKERSDFVLQETYRSLRRTLPHDSPHLSDRPENVSEERLALQRLRETLHQRTQPDFRHRRDQIVKIVGIRS
jgi:hypothetical protein